MKLDKGNKGMYFIEFTNNIKEAQLVDLFPYLEKKYWYKRLQNFDLLKFQIKNRRITPGTLYTIRYTVIISEYVIIFQNVSEQHY